MMTSPEAPRLSPADVAVAAQPINWINDDFKDLGAGTSLEQCLGEMREAGYAGTELGHRFPDDGGAITALLDRFGLRLASGWHSTFLAERPLDEERARFRKHAEKLKAAGSDVVIVAECTYAIHGDGQSPLYFEGGRRFLEERQWRALTEGLQALAAEAAALGMKTAYHEHMGTVVQDAGDVDALMAACPSLGLLVDTGHLAFTGADPLAVLDKHAARVTHVHLKNVRAGVVAAARSGGWTFERAVREGVFTVPGDPAGAVDFAAFLAALACHGYRGWLVVEAEQDPHKASPLEYARTAREYLRREAGV